MSQTAIPLEFERYLQNQISVGDAPDMNEMIFAHIPGLDPSQPINRENGLPDVSLWVHQQDIDQVGKLGDNALAYSVVIPGTVDEFTFNAIYLRDKNVLNSCGMVVHKAIETKENGMASTKSLVQAYDGAAQIAGITVDASTWQIDYQARLKGIEEDHRLACLDNYGHTAFVDGFDVTQQADPNKYKVIPGIVYVGGLRGVLAQEVIQTIVNKPNGLYVDVVRQGTALSVWENKVTIAVSETELTDYVDGNGNQHYVAKLAGINADGSVVDWRVKGEIAKLKATQLVAEAGQSVDHWMTPLTTHQAFNQFGLGKGVVFSGDDFHLLTKAGQFRVHTNSSTKNVPFGLEGHWFDVIVTGTINGRSALIAVDYGNANEPRIFHKSNANNVWSDWVELSHSGNLKLPIYPEIKTDGNVVGLKLTGTELTVYNNPVYFYGWQLHRINPTGTKFTLDLSKTYHLRFSIQSGLKLKDVTDATYNPSSKAETDASFDSTYDDMLLAKIEAGTLVPLINKPVLYAGNQMKGENNNPTHPARIFTFNWARTPIQAEGLLLGINGHSLAAFEDWNNSAREGLTGFDVMLVALDRYKVHHKYRAMDDNPSWEGGIIGTRFKQEVRA
ncbi:phage tail-collar fiber domain-containing protein [Vibrio sp. B183]|uniref:phage tail-collar fiber domain-containing protein n=1 Tax=Vibrio sp. B183 TaxID=1526762 RepID=UPI000AFCBF2B|nr:phage tail protein [Vibrio sp. B183]